MSYAIRFRLVLATLALSMLGLGCSGSSAPEESSGSLGLTLELAPGIVINEVLWKITGGEMAPMSGTIDTSAPEATASVEVFGLPPGDGYLVELTAIGEDGEVACRGDASFDVDSGESTDVMVMLNCKAPDRLGGVRVEGKPNFCPQLVKVVVSPLATDVGATIDLSALAVDVEGDDFAYRWSSFGGSIDGRTEPTATFTCDRVGPASVTVQVFNESFDCFESKTIQVECIGDTGSPMCMPSSPVCQDGEFGPVIPCCELSAPDQENACVGDESLEKPTSCTETGNTVIHELTVLELAPSCSDGYDLDGCDGSSCDRPALAPDEGPDGVDNALTASQQLWGNVGGDLTGLNQAFSDALCGLTTFQQGFECQAPIAKLRLFFVLDANLEEGCANLRVTDGLVTTDAILNLGNPTQSGTVCASGTIGDVPLTLLGFSGVLENAVVRMTVSDEGFSNALLGATIDEETAITVGELLIIGGGAVVAQLLDINEDLTGDVTARCNALSTTFVIGGRVRAEP